MTRPGIHALIFGALLVPLAPLAGCGGETVTIRADGSSTVFPITEAVAEEFMKANKGIQVTVGISGTGGGFKKFCAGETDLNDASRPIKQAEIEAAQKASPPVELIELPVAFDGLAIMVNPSNDFVTSLTVDELKRIWQPESTVKKWKDVRPEWPDRPIKLYGAGQDSGTFDYFTEAIVGKERHCRSDYTGSEDDNMLVQGIGGDKDALGFFGYAYYAENKDKLKLVAIDAGKGPVLPSEATVLDGTYQPLSRPIFIDVSKKAAARPEVESFVRFYLKNAPKLVKEVGYIPLPDKVYELALKRFEAKTTGSVFGGKGSKVGVRLEELFATM